MSSIDKKLFSVKQLITTCLTVGVALLSGCASYQDLQAPIETEWRPVNQQWQTAADNDG